MTAIKDDITWKRYPAYKESGENWIGSVPEHWEVGRLGAQFSERRTKVSDQDFPALSVTKQGVVPQLANAAKTNDGDNRKLVRSGDFVINSRSDRKGSSGVSKLDGSVSLINIVLNPDSIHPQFCNYLLKSNAFVEEYYRIGRGIVADLWTTRYSEMKNVKIGSPSPDEQTAIANFLDEKTAKIDEAIRQKEQMIELLGERKQIIIQNAVTKGLDPNVPMKDSGIEWIGEIPAHWEVKVLKRTVSIENGQVDPKALRFRDMILIAPNHIESRTGKITGLETARQQGAESGKYLAKSGCLIYSKIRPELRKSCIAPTDCLCSADMYPIYPDKSVDAEFLGLVFLGNQFNDYMVNQSMRVAMPKVNRGDVENYWMAFPPLREQKEIAVNLKLQFEGIDEAENLQTKQIKKLKEYKATLIDSAVTGKINVSNYE